MACLNLWNLSAGNGFDVLKKSENHSLEQDFLATVKAAKEIALSKKKQWWEALLKKKQW